MQILQILIKEASLLQALRITKGQELMRGTRVYGNKDSDRTNDTLGTIYKKKKKARAGNARGYHSEYGKHGPIIGKMMTRIIRSNHITLLLLLFRTSN